MLPGVLWISLSGGARHDLLVGGGGADRLVAGEGNDILLGGSGADQVYGDAGLDKLLLVVGDDILDFKEPRRLAVLYRSCCAVSVIAQRTRNSENYPQALAKLTSW
jgi:hypothetical protein